MGNIIQTQTQRQIRRIKKETQTKSLQDDFEITIGGELETWYMYFVDFNRSNRSPDGNYLTDPKDVSPTYPLPIKGEEEKGVKIEGAGRSTPIKPVYEFQTDPDHNEQVKVQKKLITFLNQTPEEAEKRSGELTFRINIQGQHEIETKTFNVPKKSMLKNKLFGGTEFIYDPLPGEKHVVTRQTLIPTFLKVIKQGIHRSQQAFQSNFVQCEVVSPSIIPNMYKTYFDTRRNLLVFSVLGGILDNILVPEDFNQIPFVPQVTFGINVYRLVDFIRILPEINASEIYSEAEDVMSRIISQSTEDKDGFKEFITSSNEMKKIIDFIFLCLYSFNDTNKATKDECDLKFRFLLRDVFRFFFKYYRSKIVEMISANVEGGKEGAKGKFIVKVLSTSQEQSKLTQRLQRVNLFGIRNNKVFVEWRRFTIMPRRFLQENTSPQTFQTKNPYRWKFPILSGAMFELIREEDL